MTTPIQPDFFPGLGSSQPPIDVPADLQGDPVRADDAAADDRPTEAVDAAAPDEAPRDGSAGQPVAQDQPRAVTEDRGLHLRPAECRVSPLNARDRSRLTPDALRELTRSIKAVGIVLPIVVRPSGDPAVPWEIIAGARRHAAASLLALQDMPGITIPAVEREMTDRDAFMVSDAENCGRVDLTAYERGCALKAARDENRASSDAELAGMMCLTTAQVSNLIRLATWDPILLAAYGSPHAILAVDAERLNPKLKQDAPDILDEARRIAAEQEQRRPRAPIPRGTVTTRLLAVTGDAPSEPTELVIADRSGLKLLRVTRRHEDGIALRLRCDGKDRSRHKQLIAAFGKLLEGLAAGRRGLVKL